VGHLAWRREFLVERGENEDVFMPTERNEENTRGLKEQKAIDEKRMQCLNISMEGVLLLHRSPARL